VTGGLYLQLSHNNTHSAIRKILGVGSGSKDPQEASEAYTSVIEIRNLNKNTDKVRGIATEATMSHFKVVKTILYSLAVSSQSKQPGYRKPES